MNETDKLRVLIPHWVDHNNEHAQEFRDWAAQAGEIAQDVLDAAEAMSRVNTHLLSALEKLGGSIAHGHG
ncbi:MAG: hypothetical protein KAV87_14765 [Desulfobacteraceae bacterium]|nr:hypothetical protein [Desulfobacteraceae bacterium]